MSTKEELYKRGVDYFYEGRADGAIAELKKALEIDPEYPDALLAIGMAYADQGMLDEAIEATKKLVALNPDDVLAHTNLSRYYMQKGMKEEAEREGNLARTLSWKEQLKQEAEKKKQQP